MRNQLLAIGLTAALVACNSEDHTIVSGGPADDVSNETVANVVLPPTILASRIYRCADNGVVYVDWLSDGKSAMVRTDHAGTRTMVSAREAGKPLTSEGGFSLEGNAEAGAIKISVPGKRAQRCQA